MSSLDVVLGSMQAVFHSGSRATSHVPDISEMSFCPVLARGRRLASRCAHVRRIVVTLIPARTTTFKMHLYNIDMEEAGIQKKHLRSRRTIRWALPRSGSGDMKQDTSLLVIRLTFCQSSLQKRDEYQNPEAPRTKKPTYKNSIP